MDLKLGEKIVKIKLKIPVIHLELGKEYDALFLPLRGDYRVLNKINDYTYLSENLFDLVYDEDFEETYRKDTEKAKQVYKDSIAEALKKYNVNKTAILRKAAEEKAANDARAKEEAEAKAKEEANQKDIAEKQAAQKEQEIALLAETEKEKAEVIAAAKKKINDEIEEKQKSITDKNAQLEKLQREISQIESNVSGNSDEDKRRIEFALSEIETIKSEIEKDEIDINLSKDQLEQIDIVNS